MTKFIYASYEEENDRPEVNDYLKEMRVKETLFNGLAREMQKLLKEGKDVITYTEDVGDETTTYKARVCLISEKELIHLRECEKEKYGAYYKGVDYEKE